MVQSLDVISVNLWSIVISLLNLLILFWLVKKFLFKPVKKVLEKRDSEIVAQYEKASEAEEKANQSKKEWEEALSGAKDTADSILTDATETAKKRSEKIVEEAEKKAASIMRQAETEAALSYKKAQGRIKEEIVSVSETLTEKMLGREINAQDHRDLIDSFIEEIGDGDDGNQ